MKKRYILKLIILLLGFGLLFFSGYAQAEEDYNQILKETDNITETGPMIVEEVSTESDADVPKMETKIFDLKYTPVEKIVEEVRKVLTEDIGQVQLGSNANQLIATDTVDKIQEIGALILKLDKEEEEVRIKAKSLQIVLNDEHLMGVDWEAIVSDYQKVELSKSVKQLNFKENLKQMEDNTQLSAGTVSNEDLMVLQEALDTVGEISVITENKTTVKNNRKIETIIGPVFSRIIDDLEGQGSGNVALKNQLIMLSLKPRVEDKNILLDIEIISELGYPAQIFETAVNIEEDSTVVLGGIFKDVLIPSMRKIPLLGDIPFLGFAFRNQAFSQPNIHVALCTVDVGDTDTGLTITEPGAGAYARVDYGNWDDTHGVGCAHFEGTDSCLNTSFCSLTAVLSILSSEERCFILCAG